MLPSQMWNNQNNPTMESWMGATSNVDYMIANGFEGFQDLQDPTYIYGPAGLTSDFDPMNLLS
jgi:hypothetical protein